MEDAGIKLTFLSCDGYGLQTADMLRRIADEKEELVMTIPIVYLVDKNGFVVCTIVRGKSQYESQENYDRRSHNCFNGFDVEWSLEGDSCTVACRVRRKAFLLAEAMAGVMRKCGILGAGVAAFFGYLRKLLSVAVKEEKRRSHTHDAQGTLSYAIKLKEKLQSTTCNKDTLNEVSLWWAQRSDAEVKQLRPFYDFGKALAMYQNFFMARKVADVQHLLWFKGVFGKRQIKVIEGYAFSDKQFSDWRKELGMSFSKPYERRYIS